MSGLLLSPSSAYRIAASAASYLQSQTRTILHSSQQEQRWSRVHPQEVLEKRMKWNPLALQWLPLWRPQHCQNDLNSSASSPCEWYICDDNSIGTRFFIIQGSDSIASWKANLLFEPVRFEGLDVLVHRGIYEAAKGIYQQLLTEVRNHLNARGTSATLRFTGHSLGGSLSLLVSFMLLVRGEVPPLCLLPVKLGLPLNHVQAIAMHRDIVPRAFSCSYPDYVAEILKALNGKFRDHPCLKNKVKIFFLGSS
ncbi:unnamed protein product [Spirodela intermedia]|uniref:Fungal lipase-type domain-containing protein n=1 Tax=Spirodela intermedia TaxID=51605 RepID=A0ABN7EAF7_SPIIN|nr:unnamed protein product [Spirodela intermedia]